MSYKPGSVIGDYVVIATVGSGGMGSVYKVQHVITQRIEAIKLLASGRTETDQEQRFVREMQVQARLHHPNIAAVYNAFRYYDEFFLVLEFVEGESLETVLSRGRLALSTGLHYARQALFALGYAHAHGVVHRDIAPSNMIITPDGTVKLTDFGLAKTATDIRLTHSGAPLGSPWYMSPEQVRGNSTLDARSDIYSLGAVLYEVATGAKPFDMASTFDVMRAQVETAPMPPLARTPDLPQALNDIILTALAKDPNARFQSAEQFYAALETLQPAEVRQGARTATPNPALAAAAASTPAARASAGRPQGLRRRPRTFRMPRFMTNPIAQAGLGTAACALTLFGGYTAYSMVRVASAPVTPAVIAAKPIIPPPPDFLLPAEPLPPANPPAVSADVPVEASEPPAPAPPPKRIRRVAARTAAPLVFTPLPARELPAPAPPAAVPAVEAPKTHPDLPPPPTVAAAPAIPKLPGPVAAASQPQSQDDPPVITGPSEATHRDKKEGNRFFRALHKVVPFHKEENAQPAASSVNGPTTDNQ